MLIQNTYIRVFGIVLLASVSIRIVKKLLLILIFLNFFRKNAQDTVTKNEYKSSAVKKTERKHT